MKRYFFFLLSLGFLTSVGEAQIPSSLYPGKIGMQQHKNFADMYQRVYEDTHVEDAREVLNRMAQRDWKRETDLDFALPLEEISQSLTETEAAALVEPGTLDISSIDTFCERWIPAVLRNTGYGKEHYRFVSKRLQELCLEERTFLREEMNMKRRLGMRSVFSNGVLDDAPFDLVADLNDIDTLFFGLYSEQPNPSFPKAQSGWGNENDLVLGDYSDEREQEPVAWMDQQSLDVDYSVDSKYPEDDTSIMSNIHNLLHPLNDLKLYSLASGCLSMRFFEPTYLWQITDRLALMHNRWRPEYINPVPVTKVWTQERTADKGRDDAVGLFGSTETDFTDQENPFPAYDVLDALILDQMECSQRLRSFGIRPETNDTEFDRNEDLCEQYDKTHLAYKLRERAQKAEQEVLDRDQSQLFLSLRQLREEIDAFFSNTKTVEAIMGRLSKTPIAQ